MRQNSIQRIYKLAFLKLYHFAPIQVLSVILLMILQGLTAGIGLLFILPLLQLVGFEVNTGATAAGFSNMVARAFASVGIPLTLKVVLTSYVVIVTTIASLRFGLTSHSAKLQQRYICSLRNTLYRRLLESDWQFIVQHKMSDFTHSLTAQVQALGMSASMMLTLLSQILLTLLMGIMAFLLSWKMSLLAIIFAAGLLGIIYPFNHIIYGSGQRQLGSYKSLFQLLTEQLSCLKMLKSYGSENYHAQQLTRVGHTLEKQALRMTRINAATQWIFMVGTVLTFSFFFYIAITMFSLPLPTTLLLLVIFSRLLPQVLGIQKSYQQLLHKLPAFDDISAMTDACSAAKECTLGQRHTPPALRHEIRLSGVSYHYPKHARNILTNFSDTITFNQTTALVGPSGSGKSTLADLVAGLLPPVAGEITCDGLPLTGDTRIAWRQSLAYVTQDVFLFHQTIRDNLSWVRDGLTDAELWQALEQASAEEFVAALPKGLDTVIGDKGVRLSGGERQRIALARALLSKPQLLILDEATSALDHANEQKIQQALQRLQGKLTILIIAHRETTIANVDKTIRLTIAAPPEAT